MSRRVRSLAAVVAAVLISIPGCSRPMDPADFIARNSAPIDLRDKANLDGFSLLDPYLGDNSVFLTGERHGTRLNRTLNLQFLKYFNREAGVRYCLIEAGHAMSCLLNMYLDTGDESILTRIMDRIQGTQANAHDTVYWWKDVREYNLTLAEDQRIRFIGIDVEHKEALSAWYLSTLLPNSGPPGTITPAIQAIMDAVERESESERSTLGASLSHSLAAHRDDYEQYLGDSLAEFEFVVRNMMSAVDCYAAQESGGRDAFDRLRDSQMCSNFLWLYERLPSGKYYGQFGAGHVYQKPGLTWFASLLNRDDSPVKGKVLTGLLLYDDCLFNLAPYGGSAQSLYSSAGITSYLLMQSAACATLYRLAGSRSPFAAGPEIPIEGDFSAPTTDYCQFVVLVRGSTSSTTYAEESK